MDVAALGTDIGACVTTFDGASRIMYCLGKEGLNFCCQQSNSSSLIRDNGQRKCCSYEEYCDQQWVLLAAIKGYSIVLTLTFILLLMVWSLVVWISCGISEADVQKSRKIIIGHLLRNQLLHKSRTYQPSVFSQIKHISHSISSGRKKKKQSQEQQQQPRRQHQGFKKLSTKASGPSLVVEKAKVLPLPVAAPFLTVKSNPADPRRGPTKSPPYRTSKTSQEQAAPGPSPRSPLIETRKESKSSLI